MIQHRDSEHRRPDEGRALRDAAAFKPLALPALAAAVRSLRSQPSRPRANQELPPILRKEAFYG